MLIYLKSGRLAFRISLSEPFWRLRQRGHLDIGVKLVELIHERIRIVVPIIKDVCLTISLIQSSIRVPTRLFLRFHLLCMRLELTQSDTI